jgi:hypothetical protein
VQQWLVKKEQRELESLMREEEGRLAAEAAKKVLSMASTYEKQMTWCCI